MSLALIGKGASYEFRWRRWALLRDVVESRLEPDPEHRRFPRLASLGEALGTGSLRVPAGELRAELRALREALAGRPLEELVLGPRTASVLYFLDQPPVPRPLSSLDLANIAPVGEAGDLREYFASMIDTMEHVCEHPLAGDQVEVLDG